VGLLSDVGVVLHRDVTCEVFVVKMAGNPWGETTETLLFMSIRE
jgi:hypothetical protein